MRSVDVIADIRARTEHAWATFHENFHRANQQLNEVTASNISPDQSVLVIMNGSFRIQSLTIHPDSLETHTGDSLADAIVDAYNGAIMAVKCRQREVQLNEIGLAEESTDD